MDNSDPTGQVRRVPVDHMGSRIRVKHWHRDGDGIVVIDDAVIEYITMEPVMILDFRGALSPLPEPGTDNTETV